MFPSASGASKVTRSLYFHDLTMNKEILEIKNAEIYLAYVKEEHLIKYLMFEEVK